MNDNELYWYLVTKCMTEIFEVPPTSARRKMLAYRTDWEAFCKKNKMQDLIYHDSPVQIASEIAKKELQKSHLEAYQEIEDRPIPKAAAIRLTTKYVRAAKSRLRA